MQSESSLSNFAEAKSILEVKLQWSRKADFRGASLNDRIASANVEFNYSTEKKVQLNFQLNDQKRPITPVFIVVSEKQKNSTEIPVELQ